MLPMPSPGSLGTICPASKGAASPPGQPGPCNWPVWGDKDLAPCSHLMPPRKGCPSSGLSRRDGSDKVIVPRGVQPPLVASCPESLTRSQARLPRAPLG